MRVLVACEFSGTVRDAFRALGHDATSCDLLDSERPGPHHKGDVLGILADGWDLMVAHPPCTHLAVSGARHFAEKRADGRQQAALDFVRALLDAPIPRIALENPVSIISSHVRKPDQVIQPWMFGHGETKATCLWLKNLPPLVPTTAQDAPLFGIEAEKGRYPRVWLEGGSKDNPKWMRRSRTYPGIAAAMAAQWGAVR